MNEKSNRKQEISKKQKAAAENGSSVTAFKIPFILRGAFQKSYAEEPGSPLPKFPRLFRALPPADRKTNSKGFRKLLHVGPLHQRQSDRSALLPMRQRTWDKAQG